MQDTNCHVVFGSTLADWTAVNSSFDRGVLRIAYHGKNRNAMYIGKEAFNDAIKSVFNCPVVCNYHRDSDSVGAHDVDIVNQDGAMHIVNITTPVGVVPESANVWWTEVVEENGEVHEYLCTDILIWKRQEAYEHLKKNGITSESMEIRIISGEKRNDGLYYIDKFEFLAFCLLESAPPCFESANIELFSLDDFKVQYAQMMEDVKREFTTVITASADDIHTQSYSKGGICELDVNELMTKYSISAEDVVFDTTAMSIDEIERKFAEIKAAKDDAAVFGDGDEPEPISNEPSIAVSEAPVAEAAESSENENSDDDDDVSVQKKQDYSLTASQFVSELCDALDAVRYNDPYWGDVAKYCFMDYDVMLNEVYVVDMEDFKLYGMPFSMNGDKVVIDFAQCKRKKTCYIDFDEGEATFAEVRAFANLVPKLHEKFKELNNALEELKAFKAEIDAQARKDEVNRVFSKFTGLAGNADFEALRANYDDMSVSQIEEKCFAIRGRCMPANFSWTAQNTPIRLPVEMQASTDADEPYGGIFAKYGIGRK